jgi:hypothetical protein
MFEKIAGENNVQTVLRERPRGGAILMHKLNAVRQLFGRARIEIHREPPLCFDIIDEFPISAAEIQDGS